MISPHRRNMALRTVHNKRLAAVHEARKEHREAMLELVEIRRLVIAEAEHDLNGKVKYDA